MLNALGNINISPAGTAVMSFSSGAILVYQPI